MTDRLKETFKELNMTKEEIERFGEAMKKEEFRKLLVEYAEEISDPKNRELYEQEITKLEQERGMNVVFINPEPGYCIKTAQNGSKKCFINICKNENIEKPHSQRATNQKGNSGLTWHIPHTCSQPREDVDKTGEKECTVYDVVFHPDAYRMGETNQRFNALLKDSAFETIERNFNVKLDKVNAKVLKNLTFKGRPAASVIRKPVSDKPKDSIPVNLEDKNDPMGSVIDKLKEEYFQSQLGNSIKTNHSEAPASKKLVQEIAENEKESAESKFTKPVHKIVHRGQVDMQDYSNQVDQRIVQTTRPKELCVSIELPLCKTSENLILDIFEKKLYLESNEPNYKLDLALPYPIDEKEARAKFDKSKRCLNVTLPVVPFVHKVNLTNEINNNSNVIVDNNNKSDGESSFAPSSPSSVGSACSSTSLNEIGAEESSSNQQSTTSISSNNKNRKFNLPTKCYVKEFKSSFSIKFKVFSYEQNSVQVQFVPGKANLFKMSCESTSKSSGYTQYFQVYVTLMSNNSNNNSESFIDDANFRLVFLNEDMFEIKLAKLSSNSSGISVAQKAVQKLEEEDSEGQVVDVNLESLDSDDPEWNGKNEKSILVAGSMNNNSKDMNKMSRKDYVLNFQQVVVTSAGASPDSDEDEEKENDEKRATKFAKALTTEKAKFEKNKKKASPVSSAVASSSSNCLLNTEIKIQEKIQEEEEEEEEESKVTFSNNYEDENNNNEDEEEMSDTEKEFLQCQGKEGEFEKRDSESLSSSTNDSSTLGSSLNGSNSFYKLKGILKKPRSFSESEGALMMSSSFNPAHKQDSLPCMSNLSRSSFDSSNDDNSSSGGQQSNSKKSVKFNNQVIRNTFKTGSTVAGMRKPGHSSKKKNKRKRTVSDPSHDSGADALSLKEDMANQRSAFNRARSVSESSDDNGGCGLDRINSNESLSNDENTEKKVTTQNESSSSSKKSSAKKKKKNKSQQPSNQVSGGEKKENPFTVETMLEWKNQGRLNENQNATKCAFKFSNKIINQLD